MSLPQDQQNKMFGDEGKDIWSRWTMIQNCVLEYFVHMMGASVQYIRKIIFNSTPALCLTLLGHFAGTMICKDSIDALYLCPHIPYSAIVNLYVAAALGDVDNSPLVDAQNIQREKMLVALNVCLERLVSKQLQIHSNQYECLMYQSSVIAVKDADLYNTHLLSFVGVRNIRLSLQELLLLSVRQFTSINLDCSRIHRLYCDLIDDMESKIATINCFTVKGKKANKAGLEAISKLQTTVAVFHANFCVREHIFDAANVLKKVVHLAKVQATVDLHLWHLPLFDHCKKLCKYLGVNKHKEPLGYRSVQLSVEFFFECMSEELNRVLVYDRQQTLNSDLPKHMDLAMLFLSNQYTDHTDLWPIIGRQLMEHLK